MAVRSTAVSDPDSLAVAPVKGQGRVSSDAAPRPVVAIDQTAARAALAAAVERAAALIRTIPDPNRSVPRLSWTVGETAAHMVIALRVYTECARGRQSPVSDFADLPSISKHGIDRFPERRPADIADQLVKAGHWFLDATAGWPADAPMMWHEGQPQAVSTVTTIALGEMLIHGLDVARSLGSPWPIDAHEARLVIAGMTRLLPRFASERTLRGATATYEIRLRGGERFVCRFANGGLTVEPPAARSTA